jgi:hypothetical protein
MQFLFAFTKLASIIQGILPMFAAAHAAQVPGASNNGIKNVSEAIGAAQSVVAGVESIGTAHAAAGNPALSGVDKLAIAQSLVQTGHDVLIKSGATTATFDQYWTPINAAISVVCAASKAVQPVDSTQAALI